MHSERLAQDAGAVLSVVVGEPPAANIEPADITPQGAQLPLFVGNCLHCGTATPRLPTWCHGCGRRLETLVPPSIKEGRPWRLRLFLWLEGWRRVARNVLWFMHRMDVLRGRR